MEKKQLQWDENVIANGFNACPLHCFFWKRNFFDYGQLRIDLNSQMKGQIKEFN